MSTFLKTPTGFQLQDDSGSLVPVSDPRQLAGLQSGATPALDVSGMSFGVNAPPTTTATAPTPAPAPSQAPADPMSAFLGNTYSMLQKFQQTNSLQNTGLLNTESQLQGAQINNSMAPAAQAGLAGLTPADALAARQQLGTQYNPAISTINARLQLQNESLANFEKLITQAKDYGEDIVKFAPGPAVIDGYVESLLTGARKMSDIPAEVIGQVTAAGLKKDPNFMQDVVNAQLKILQEETALKNDPYTPLDTLPTTTPPTPTTPSGSPGHAGAPGSSAAVNNPMGIKPGGKFTQYATMDQGFQAGADLIKRYQTGQGPAGINANSTLLDMVKKWTGNSDGAYASSVAKDLGVSLTTKIGTLDTHALATSIANHESPGWNNQSSPTSTSTVQAPGTTGSPKIDTSTPGYSSTPLPRAGNLTQAAIDQAAMKYALTGTMPSIGLSSTGQGGMRKNAILNRAGELEGASNIEGNKVRLSALNTSLGKQTDYLNTMERSINTVDDNLQILMTGAGKVNQSDSPLVNEWTNLANKKVLGSGDLAAYKSAIQTVRTEYSNILARGGTITDAVRAEATDLIPGNITKAQLQQVLEVLHAEGANVKKEAQAQVDNIAGQINNLVAPSSPSPSPESIPAPTAVPSDPGGRRLVIQDHGGNQHTIPASQLKEAISQGYTFIKVYGQ